MKLQRVGLKTEVSAPGISGAWYEVGRDGIERLDLLGGSTVVIGKGGGNAKTIAVPIENVAYFVPADLSAIDEQPVTIPADGVPGTLQITEYEAQPPKRGPGRPKKQSPEESA